MLGAIHAQQIEALARDPLSNLLLTIMELIISKAENSPHVAVTHMAVGLLPGQHEQRSCISKRGSQHVFGTTEVSIVHGAVGGVAFML